MSEELQTLLCLLATFIVLALVVAFPRPSRAAKEASDV